MSANRCTPPPPANLVRLRRATAAATQAMEPTARTLDPPLPDRAAGARVHCRVLRAAVHRGRLPLALSLHAWYSMCRHGMAIDLSIGRRRWHGPCATAWAGLGGKWRVSSGKQRSVGTMQRRATTCIMQHAAACNSRHGRALTAERCARAGSDDGSLHIWDDRRYRLPAPIRVATLWRRINVDHAVKHATRNVQHHARL